LAPVDAAVLVHVAEVDVDARVQRLGVRRGNRAGLRRHLADENVRGVGGSQMGAEQGGQKKRAPREHSFPPFSLKEFSSAGNIPPPPRLRERRSHAAGENPSVIRGAVPSGGTRRPKACRRQQGSPRISKATPWPTPSA